MKKIPAIFLAFMIILSFSACGAKDSGTGSNANTGRNTAAGTDETKQEETPKNATSDGYAKFSQLKIGMSESEVNAILGEPTSVDKASYYYTITVNGKDMELVVWISTVSGTVINIRGNFHSKDYRDEFADAATSLSKAGDLDSGEISTYDDCVSAFKTQGYLISIDENDVAQYLWVTTSGAYMTVTVDADGNVKKYSGMV